MINFRLLAQRNFGFGTLANFMLGFALYGSAYLLPQYLANAQGFDAQQIGVVMAWTGLPQLVIIPLVPLLMRRIDGRLLVGTGLVVFAASCFMNLQHGRRLRGAAVVLARCDPRPGPGDRDGAALVDRAGWHQRARTRAMPRASST